MRKILSIFSIFILIPVLSLAEEAPKSTKQFNRNCPANELCPLFEQAYLECFRSEKEPVCLTYVFVFQKLFADVD